MPINPFKRNNSFARRCLESQRIISKYPDRLPVICQKSLHVNGNIPSVTELISSIYEREHDQDGFLYIDYSQENTFG